MKVFVAGATGATGRLVVDQLLERKIEVKVVVRSPERLTDESRKNTLLNVIEGSLLNFNDEEFAQIVDDCDAVVSCLGHNLTLKGIYGAPRRLVSEATRRLCNAVKVNNRDLPVKYILMNTTGNRNPDADKPMPLGEKIVLGLIRLLVPPHSDNERAANYLNRVIGQSDKNIDWVAVRPDTLLNAEEVSEYELFPSPVRSPIFNAGQTSRINVAQFMAELITNKGLWDKWKGQMPVIYNK
ncbi:MAG: SDR family oxidoreductase [Spirochaetales bacterium]|nr:SDR family oxidoreductase [Spirochaetales bacterium]